ncbi:MAG TPA: hypothetical protein VMT59_12860 [Gaiellaceae bacterium]|nr:hypothetical protein [Gaiellaceae bacterium]
MPATVGPSHLDITAREFERRLVAHGHTPDEIARLWNEIAPEQTAERRLAFGPMIAVYIGVLLVVAASAALIAIYWTTLDPWGVLVLGIAYLAGCLLASELFRLRGFAQPAEILEAVSVGFVAVIAYAVERIAGFWPDDAHDLGYLHQGITGIVIAGLVFGAVLMAVRPAPLVLVPLGLGTALLAADAAELVFGNDSGSSHFAFVLPVGLAWIGAGLWLDVTRRRRYATWAYWVGLTVTGISLINLVPKTVPGFALIGVLGALAMFFSALVRHWSFTVIGAFGVLTAVTAGMQRLGGLAPLGAAVLGVALIFVGLRWARWREPIREAVLSRLPARARDFVVRLAP